MPTLTQLSSNLTEIVIYAAIALVTLTGLCKCIYPLLRNATLLNRAVIKLEKSTAAGERPIWREARFLGRSLRNEWQQFCLTPDSWTCVAFPAIRANISTRKPWWTSRATPSWRSSFRAC